MQADVGRREVLRSLEDGVEVSPSSWLQPYSPWAWHRCCRSVFLDVHGIVCAQPTLGAEHCALSPGQTDLRKCPKSVLPRVDGEATNLPKLTCACSVPQLTHLLSLAAEKVTSLGKDWHRPCLRCEKCNKTLTSGGHAEVRFAVQEVPVPCS